MAPPENDDKQEKAPAKRRKKATPEVPNRTGLIAIVGRPNVGKSTLLNSILGQAIAITSPRPQTTRDGILGVHTTPHVQYVFTDTPGLHLARTKLGSHMNRLAHETARDADVIVFVTTLRQHGPKQLSEIDTDLLRKLPEGKPVILVANKVDQVKDKAELFPWLENVAKERPFVAIVPMCARRGDGIPGLLKEIAEHLPEAPRLYEEDTLSDKPVRFFVSEFVREQILRKTHEEVPHGVNVVVERFDESQPVTHIELAIHVAKESHKGIILGAKGALIKAIGTDARAKVEALLERHVHMKLWVRVTPEWFEDEALLKDFGYAKEDS